MNSAHGCYSEVVSGEVAEDDVFDVVSLDAVLHLLGELLRLLLVHPSQLVVLALETSQLPLQLLYSAPGLLLALVPLVPHGLVVFHESVASRPPLALLPLQQLVVVPLPSEQGTADPLVDLDEVVSDRT